VAAGGTNLVSAEPFSLQLWSAILCLGLLWGWQRFVGTIALGFAGMLHPNEFIQLITQDLVFPEDALLQQHACIDDTSVILLARLIFAQLPLSERSFGASIAVFQ